MYPEKLPVRRVDAIPQRVPRTYASTRVPGGSWRPSGLKTSPENTSVGGAAPSGAEAEKLASNLADFPLHHLKF